MPALCLVLSEPGCRVHVLLGTLLSLQVLTGCRSPQFTLLIVHLPYWLQRLVVYVLGYGATVAPQASGQSLWNWWTLSIKAGPATERSWTLCWCNPAICKS